MLWGWKPEGAQEFWWEVVGVSRGSAASPGRLGTGPWATAMFGGVVLWEAKNWDGANWGGCWLAWILRGSSQLGEVTPW